MHIMVAAPEHGRGWGGIGTYLTQLVRGVGGAHEFTILSSGGSRPDAGGARIVPVAGSGGTMSNYAKFQLALRRRLPSLLREYRPDLFVVHHAQMPDLLVSPPTCPTVVTTHTTIAGQAAGALTAMRERSPLDASERATLTALPVLLPAELIYWRKVRHAVFVSNAVRAQVEKTCSPRLRTSATIPNGLTVDGAGIARDPPEPSEGGDFLLFGGRLLGVKGIALLLRAFARVPANGTRLVLAGTGDVARWRQFARSCGLPDGRVEFLGGVSHEEYLVRLKEAVGFVLPSYSESCPYALIEAMAFQKPIVAAAVGGVPDMVDADVAMLVAGRDEDGLARALTRLLSDNALRRRLGRNAQARWRERFSADRMCLETMRYFEDVLSASGAG